MIYNSLLKTADNILMHSIENNTESADKKSGQSNRSDTGWAKRFLFSFCYVLAVCGVIAIVITVLTSKEQLKANLVMSYALGINIHLFTFILIFLFKPSAPGHTALLYLIALVGGTLNGMWTGTMVLKACFSHDMAWQHDFLQTAMVCIVPATVVTYYFYTRTRIRLDNEAIEVEKNRREAIEKEALKGKLRMLQAQIEPHFLFNTLSNVISLIDTQPESGKAMLINLVHYLRTSLARTLPEETTLGQEIRMIRAYLDIQKIRMGDRLDYHVEFSDHLSNRVFPPMLLQPLVENAVKHGLEPTVKGGKITVCVSEENNFIKVNICDTGLGISDIQKTGVGLSNVKERLRLLFEDRGRLILTENTPQGVCAVIEVPINDH